MSEYIVVHGIQIAKDFTPETYGRLTTIGPKFILPYGNYHRRHAKQVCQCECGVTLVVNADSLPSKNTTSCGCFKRDQSRQTCLERNAKQGCTTKSDRLSPMFVPYAGMKQRCLNTNSQHYQSYGGRGIQVCSRWLDPENGFKYFCDDMGPRPSRKYSLDRIDNNGNYCPENCRWATHTEQCRNQRTNRLITHNGKTQCLGAWAEECQISPPTLHNRLKKGWSVEKALTTQVKSRKK